VTLISRYCFIIKLAGFQFGYAKLMPLDVTHQWAGISAIPLRRMSFEINTDDT
jgi:hypothetical protein